MTNNLNFPNRQGTISLPVSPGGIADPKWNHEPGYFFWFLNLLAAISIFVVRANYSVVMSESKCQCHRAREWNEKYMFTDTFGGKEMYILRFWARGCYVGLGIFWGQTVYFGWRLFLMYLCSNFKTVYI